MMRDVEDRGAGRTQPHDKCKKLLDFAPCEARRRLVEDQDRGRLGKRLADLQHLLLRHAQKGHSLTQICRKPELIEHRSASLFLTLAIKKAGHLSRALA